MLLGTALRSMFGATQLSSQKRCAFGVRSTSVSLKYDSEKSTAAMSR